ncbi:hypothetical protein M422DRAFT_30385 [Sphaerobolus stellatus SS14]|uniref:Uncharacterized protein n=1 Tax=Sphaerobolus stellatus (strain SS14) TaxID=990650 RepID=A0A0C9UMB6_SPHS4|nr:hypothetical protein M422DRAFT_30385 [Sphaerobolus stellatus SS14]
MSQHELVLLMYGHRGVMYSDSLNYHENPEQFVAILLQFFRKLFEQVSSQAWAWSPTRMTKTSLISA